MNPAITRLLELAQSQEGFEEGPNNQTKYAFELDKEEIPKIPRQGSPWCGTFTDWCFKRSGNWAAMRDVSMFATQGGLRKAERFGMVTRNLGDLSRVQPGDLVVKSYTQWTGHVGIVRSVDPFLGIIETWEGNTAVGNDRTGGKVMRRTRSATFWTAAIRPAWELVSGGVDPTEDWVPAIDVAKYQGDIRWGQVAKSGVELAIVKLHNTRDWDPMAERNITGAAAAGLGVAVYWYARSRLSEDPAECASDDRAFRWSNDDFIFEMADIEAGENCPLTPECVDWWNRYIAALPDEVWLYGGAGYLGALDQDLVRRHPVITARYPRQGPNPAPDHWDEHALGLPAPKWPTAFEWAGWQFTSSGSVPGVPARCDLNIIRRSALGWAPSPGAKMSDLKIVQERGKPALYLASTDGIAYRWIKDQSDLAFVQFLVTTKGGSPDTVLVDPGSLSLFGVLVGPEPVQ